MSKVVRLKAELLTSAEAAERWPHWFEIEDDEIIGFTPSALDGESDFYDSDPEHVIVIFGDEGDPRVWQSYWEGFNF